MSVFSIKLRQPLIQPQGDPLRGLAEEKVRVLVIDHLIRVFTLGVHPHQHIVFVGRLQKKSAQLELPFCQIELPVRARENLSRP